MHVSPLQTLRRDVDSRVLRMGRDPAGIVVTLTIVASVLAIAFARTSEPRAALAMAGGTAAAIALLMASAQPKDERMFFRALLLWAIAMIAVVPLLVWFVFVQLGLG